MNPDLTSHWARSTWAPGERRLHWYVLPPNGLHHMVQRVQQSVARPEVTAIPGPWLHCTVIALRDSATVSSAVRGAALLAGQAAMKKVAPFHTSPGIPAVWGEAIVFDLSPSPGLGDLHHRLTHVCAGLLRKARPDHFTPHVTFSYAHASGESASTAQALAGPSSTLAPFHVSRVMLLDVLREPGPEFGWYSWNVVGEARLGQT